MGNKPFKIGLKVDQLQCQAGEKVTGRVYVSCRNRNEHQLQNVTGIHLLLEGVEHVEIAQKEPDARTRQAHDRTPIIERSTHTLVRTDYPIVRFEKGLRQGQYEYPFEWRLPNDLPGTIHCLHKDKRSFGEIRYTLTAYLKSPQQSISSLALSELPDPAHRASTVLCVSARPSTRISRSIDVDTEVFPIKTCSFWKNGNILLGWQAESDTASPEQTIAIRCWGANKSHVQVRSLIAKVVETVTWETNEDHSRSMEHTLVTKRIPLSDDTKWQPSPISRQSSPADALDVSLVLPRETRDSYSGRVVQVRHAIVVTVQTLGACTVTNPESSAMLTVVRPGSTTTTAAAAAAPTVVQPTAPPCTSQPMAEVELLPEDWQPVEADVIVLPEASAVVIDQEAAPPSTFNESDSLQPTAPQESLLYEEVGPSVLSSDELQLLKSLVTESPENLQVVLQDATWATMVQNLSPRAFCTIVGTTGMNAPSVARTLAICMGEKFECRHVLACLWTLPEYQRMPVLQQVASLASDLRQHQWLLEKELDPKELVHFRAALRN